MAKQDQSGKQPRSSDDVAALAEEALKVFQQENPEAYKDLVETFEGKAADVALLGHGKFHISVQKSEVSIEPNVIRGGASTGRGAITPETLMTILEGKSTPLQEFFRGNLIARANSTDLHLAYDKFVEFAETALRSKELQEILAKFREQFGV